MAQRKYGQFFHAAHTGQTNEDRFYLAGPLHPSLIAGRFTIYWISSESSAAIASARTLISFGTPSTLVWSLTYLFGVGMVFGSNVVPVTFTAMRELRFDVDEIAETLTISGALTGNGVHAITGRAPLSSGDGVSIGGAVNGTGESARGWVTKAYALRATAAPFDSGVLTLEGDDIELDGDDITFS